MSMRRQLARIALLSAALLVLIPLTPIHAQPRLGGELVFVTTEEPDTLDAQKTSAAVTGNVMRWMADTLVTKDLSGNYTGALAKSWTVSRDGLTWTFQLKENVKFHDGTPFNAQSVKGSSSARSHPRPSRRLPVPCLARWPVLRRTGALTVVIKLKESFSPFLDNLTDPRASHRQPAGRTATR